MVEARHQFGGLGHRRRLNGRSVVTL
jgi:hypothetical protein